MNKKITKLSFFKYLVVLVIAVFIVITVRFFASRKQVNFNQPKPAVSVAYPTTGTIEESITLSGHIEAKNMVPVIPMVGGTILEYPAIAGSSVKKGELLALIDDEPFKQQMLQAEAAYSGYEKSFNRVAGLYKAGAASRQEYDTVKAQKDAAKAQLDLARLQVGYAKITSPVDGTIIAAPMVAGGAAGAPNPVAIVADLSDLVVRLNVPEKYYSLFIAHKDTISARIIKPGVKGLEDAVFCDAAMDTIASYVDGTSKTFESTFKLTNPPEDFVPGMFIKVAVVFKSHSFVPVIPLSALESDGTLYLFEKDPSSLEDAFEDALEENGGVAKSILFDEYITDSQWIKVPEQYKNSQFIIKGQSNVLSGQQVRAIEETLLWKNE